MGNVDGLISNDSDILYVDDWGGLWLRVAIRWLLVWMRFVEIFNRMWMRREVIEGN